MKYYDQTRNCLIFIQEQATPEFWDKHWATDNFREIVTAGRDDRFILDTTGKYLNTGRILEGGCGTGAKVYALHHHGYDVYGVDFAIQTVKMTTTSVPELQILPADVMHLPFRSATFDGYWSLGVIEHFYAGYEYIADEMKRVLKNEGILFLTFPSISPLRWLKAKVGLYPVWDESFGAESFYQFALDKDQVIMEFKKRGFQILESRTYDGIKGFKDEITIIKPLFQRLYNYSGKSAVIHMARQILGKFLEPLAGHMTLLVLKKREIVDGHE